jgi:predicted HTH transcriptional regulator
MHVAVLALFEGGVNSMDKQKLLALLQKPEGTKLDFKKQMLLRTDSEKKELSKDVCAIANAKGGRGYIIFGVEDYTKRIVGIEEVKYREEQMQQIISQRCDPPVQIAFEIIYLENKPLGVLTIYKSNQKPHQIRQTGTFYIRRGSTTDIARREEIASMLQESGLLEYERTVLSNIDFKELDEAAMKNYINKMGLKSDEEGYYTILEGMGILGKEEDSNRLHPTIGGLLLFCPNPQAFLPYTGIKVVCNTRNKEIKMFKGPITKMLEDIEAYFNTMIKNTDYPISALMEAVSNAVLHRDYYEINRETVVIIGRKKIEISNPGAACSMEESHSMEEHYPCRRNQWLYQRLLTLDEKRFLKSGLGVNRIQAAFKGRGQVSFINNDKRNLFKVVFPGF